jgi:hypothetical protein
MLGTMSWKALCAGVMLMAQPQLLNAARNKQDSEILATFGQPIQIFGDVSNFPSFENSLAKPCDR